MSQDPGDFTYGNGQDGKHRKDNRYNDARAPASLCLNNFPVSLSASDKAAAQQSGRGNVLDSERTRGETMCALSFARKAMGMVTEQTAYGGLAAFFFSALRLSFPATLRR